MFKLYLEILSSKSYINVYFLLPNVHCIGIFTLGITNVKSSVFCNSYFEIAFASAVEILLCCVVSINHQ